MKVLMINSGHFLGGGAHTVYLSNTAMLREAGVEVINFAQHSNKDLPCEQSEFFPKEIPQSKKLQYIKNRFYNKEAAQCLQRLLDKEHPDIAHVHLMWGTIAPSILEVLKKNNIPVVHTVHDYAMICSLATLRSTSGKVCERCSGGRFFESAKTRCHRDNWLRSYIASIEIASRNKRHHPVNLITHFLFVSHFCENKHCDMDSRFVKAKKNVLYNIPNANVIELAKERIPDTFNSYYLYYGRLSYEKGVNTLISAFIENPQLTLKIVGTGPLEANLKERCEKAGVGNIEFLGFKTGEELYRIVQEAKYVCVPSEWYENNPMTIVEAYTLGTPVIAARIGGIPEIVEDNNTGYLFESSSVEQLCLALNKSFNVTEEDYNQMKKNAQMFSEEKFEPQKYIDRLLTIYQETING